MDKLRQEQEVDRNYDAFMKMLDSILHEHRDQLAQMRDGEIAGYFETPRQALIAASKLFADDIFSIQEVTDEPIDLGFLSHVVLYRPTSSCQRSLASMLNPSRAPTPDGPLPSLG